MRRLHLYLTSYFVLFNYKYLFFIYYLSKIHFEVYLYITYLSILLCILYITSILLIYAKQKLCTFFKKTMRTKQYAINKVYEEEYRKLF